MRLFLAWEWERKIWAVWWGFMRKKEDGRERRWVLFPLCVCVCVLLNCAVKSGFYTLYKTHRFVQSFVQSVVRISAPLIITLQYAFSRVLFLINGSTFCVVLRPLFNKRPSFLSSFTSKANPGRWNWIFPQVHPRQHVAPPPPRNLIIINKTLVLSGRIPNKTGQSFALQVHHFGIKTEIYCYYYYYY